MRRSLDADDDIARKAGEEGFSEMNDFICMQTSPHTRLYKLPRLASLARDARSWHGIVLCCRRVRRGPSTLNGPYVSDIVPLLLTAPHSPESLISLLLMIA